MAPVRCGKGGHSGNGKCIFATSVCLIDMPSALVRFIIPLLLTGLAAYVFRLFGFGWRIYRPAANSRDRWKGDGVALQVSMIRERLYLPFIDAIGEEILHASGDIDEFRRLRSELVARERSNDSTIPRDQSAEVNELVAGIIDIYRESTGKEGLTPPVFRRP